ncbi:Carotenoid 9,10(9',10')-cleavage dioxygenase 1, partial [Capsicum baccatum]
MDEDISRLKTTTIGLLNDLDCNGSILSEDLINEMSRYDALELYIVAVFIGGVASQEVIKIAFLMEHVKRKFCHATLDLQVKSNLTQTLEATTNLSSELSANTTMIYHHGKLLALHEGDKPYVVKVLDDGDLQMLGMLDYDKRLQYFFTAHPKVDPVIANAWEEEYDVVLITFRLQNPDLDAVNGTEKEQQHDGFTNQ